MSRRASAWLWHSTHSTTFRASTLAASQAVASLAKGSAYDWPQAKVATTLNTIGALFTGNAPTMVSSPISWDSWQLNVTLVSGNRDGPAIANMMVLNLLPRGKPEPRDLFRFNWTRKLRHSSCPRPRLELVLGDAIMLDICPIWRLSNRQSHSKSRPQLGYLFAQSSAGLTTQGSFPYCLITFCLSASAF